MNIMYCRTCGNKINDNAEICVKCGCKPLIGKSYCQNCGADTTEQQAPIPIVIKLITSDTTADTQHPFVNAHIQPNSNAHTLNL